MRTSKITIIELSPGDAIEVRMIDHAHQSVVIKADAPPATRLPSGVVDHGALDIDVIGACAVLMTEAPEQGAESYSAVNGISVNLPVTER